MEWLVERGTDFEGMVLITESVPGGAGKSVAQLALEYERESAEMVLDILLEDPDAWIVYHCISKDDMDIAVLWPDSIICSDSWSYPVNAPKQIGLPHPRTYGAFTRFLERYVLRESRMTFGEAVRKISSLPAQWLNLPLRGCIAEGYFADLVLLDPGRVHERATYLDPRQFSEGTEFVWVNGALMLNEGVLNHRSPGHIVSQKDV